MNMAAHAMERNKKTQTMVMGLIVLSLLSAFFVVYLKDLNRRLFIEFQGTQKTEQIYRVQTGKLLLEQSTWSRQARIQSIASDQLGMIAPKAKNIVMVEGVGETYASNVEY